MASVIAIQDAVGIPVVRTFFEAPKHPLTGGTLLAHAISTRSGFIQAEERSVEETFFKRNPGELIARFQHAELKGIQLDKGFLGGRQETKRRAEFVPFSTRIQARMQLVT